jgi:hypothetical protein
MSTLTPEELKAKLEEDKKWRDAVSENRKRALNKRKSEMEEEIKERRRIKVSQGQPHVIYQKQNEVVIFQYNLLKVMVSPRH